MPRPGGAREDRADHSEGAAGARRGGGSAEPPVAIDRPGGGKTILAEAGDYYRYVGQIVLGIDGGVVSLQGGGLIPIDASVPRTPDPVGAMVQGYESSIVAMYGDVFHTAIATASGDFPNRWDPAAKARDTAAGNLVTDIYRRFTGTDLAMEAMGLQEGTLVAGPIVGEDVFRLMPYGPPPLGYPLVTMHLTGAALLQGLELSVSMIARRGTIEPAGQNRIRDLGGNCH